MPAVDPQCVRSLVGLAATVSLALGMTLPSSSWARKPPLRIVGYAENAVVYPGGFRIKAKMDTGAQTTSIHAPNFEIFKRDGKRWVKFTLEFNGRNTSLELPIHRISRIRRTGVGRVERPVIRLGICIAGYYKLAEVNLANRKGMNFPLLIGRRFMRTGRIVVDSGRKYRLRPDCPDAPKGR